MKAVIFDLFETLITEWGKHKYTNKEVATDLGISLHEFRAESAKLQKKRYSGEISETVQFYKMILEQLCIERDEHLLHTIVAKREKCKRDCFKIIVPEILDMLNVLKTNGFLIGMISNCSTEEILGLKDSALYSYFDTIVLSCDVGLVKPDVKIYEHCASLLQVESSNCFFVGDGGSDELNGAKNARMTPLKALWFTKYFAKDLDLPDKYPLFVDIKDLKSFLCKQRIFW